MPEGLEAEIWRQALNPVVGRRITGAWVDERVAPAGFVREVALNHVASWWKHHGGLVTRRACCVPTV